MNEASPPVDASMTIIDTPTPQQQPPPQPITSKDASTSLIACNGGATDATNAAAGLMRASDLDLRKTKGELFSKLTERQPQQMIVTPALHRRSSDENINSSSLASFKGLNRIEFTCHGSSNNCSTVEAGSVAGVGAGGRQQLSGHHKQQKLVTTMQHNTCETAPKQQQQQQQPGNLLASKQEPVLFSRIRCKWYTNEEVASILTSYSEHPEWQSNELQMRPKSGAVLLYSREKVRYRQDGYCWKKRKNGRTTREDHMKLKVQGIECIYGCYVHSALLPTFHRRCYWLLENPDIVLVHYLNQPPDDKNKMILTFNSGLLESDTKRRWTNEEIIEEIGSVFGGISQIHRTLSINFPAVAAAPLPLALQGDGERQMNGQGQSECGTYSGDGGGGSGQCVTMGNASASQQTDNRVGNLALYNSDSNNNRNNTELDMLIINEQHNHQAGRMLQGDSMAPPGNSRGVVDEDDDDDDEDDEDDGDEEGEDEDDDEMITINQDNSNSRDNYNRLQRHSLDTPRSHNLDEQHVGGKTGENNGAPNSNCAERHNNQRHHHRQADDDAMTLDIVIDQQQRQQQQRQDVVGVENANIEPGTATQTLSQAGPSSGMLIYSMDESGSIEPKHSALIDNVQDVVGDQSGSGSQSIKLDSNSFCDQSAKSFATEQQHQQQQMTSSGGTGGPCSPVTQIYNKIIDDIETYAIPFELSQFDSSHHHHHSHLHHDSTNEIQSMDTSEPDQQQQQSSANHLHHHHHPPVPVNQFSTDHHHHLHHRNKTEPCSSVQLVACDIFANCDGASASSGETGNGPGGVGVKREPGVANDDMLLGQFELSTPDEGGPADERVVVGADDDDDGLGSNVDEMRDLMMGISSNDPTDDSNQANQLLLSCQDATSDPLDLFSFKPLECGDPLKHHHHHLLDVKSTTSETETLDRLSPIASGRQPPRCNSSDDAMQLSTQRLDQYLHHASINFLANSTTTTTTTTNTSAQEDEHHHHHQLIDSFSDYADQQRQLHHLNDVTIAHRSSGSTEQSNSTSSSSLLNATSGLGTSGCSGLSGGSYSASATGSATDQGAASSLGSNYNAESSTTTTTTSSSYIKLPLPQRQNSEQKEPSNSVLSSLLPKALSLDGSDLSSANQHYSNSISNQAQNHHHHHNHQSGHHHHHHHHHHQRASPLVGPYHTGGGSHHARTATAGANHQGQTRSGAYGSSGSGSGHLLLVPTTGGHHTSRHHHYQRPSAPTISASTGTYSLDSSLSGSGGGTGAKLLVNGGPYRSGSVAASTALCYQAQAPIQQQQSSVTECVRLAESSMGSRARLLPILDYVPNWSPSSGGAKILLIGPWTSLSCEEASGQPGSSPNPNPNEEFVARSSNNSVTSDDEPQPGPELNQRPQESSSFYILFDDLAVPATLIQDNVLRCYSPCHEPGFIALKVLHRNMIVSEQVLFEVRPSGPVGAPETSTRTAEAVTQAPPTSASTTTATTTVPQ